MSEQNLKAGDTIQFSVEAEVVCRYESGRVKVRWHSGEEAISEHDNRLNND